MAEMNGEIAPEGEGSLEVWFKVRTRGRAH